MPQPPLPPAAPAVAHPRTTHSNHHRGAGLPPPRHTRASTLLQSRAAVSGPSTARNVAKEVLSSAIDYRFATVRDVPAGDLMTGLSAINAENLVGSLIEADAEYWQRVMAWFARRQREIDDEMEQVAEEEGERKRRFSEAVRRKSSSSGASATASGSASGGSATPLAPAKRKPGKSARSGAGGAGKPGGVAGADTGDSDDDAEQEQIGLPSRKRHDPRFGLAPWRAVFTQWLALLDDELAAGNRTLVFGGGLSAGAQQALMAVGGTAPTPSTLIPLEVFIRRVAEATRGAVAAAGSSSLSPSSPSSPITSAAESGSFSSLRSPTLAPPTVMGGFSPSQVPRYLASVPHVMATATAMWCFYEHLIPLLGPYAPVARRAFAELVKAIYMFPSQRLLDEIKRAEADERMGGDGDKNADGSAPVTVDQSSLDLVLADDASTRFVNATFVTEWHRQREMFVQLRAVSRKKSVVMERQELILHKTVLRMTSQTAKRLIVAWRLLAARNKKLRERYRGVFAGMSQSVFIKAQIRHWKAQARMILIRRRAEEEGRAPQTTEHIARKKHIAQSQELAVLIEQKRYKEVMIERGNITNRELRDKLSRVELTTRQAREKMAKVAAAFAQALDSIAPPPDQLFAIGTGRHRRTRIASEMSGRNSDDDSLTSGDDDDDIAVRAKARIVHWIALMAEKDTATAGNKLSHLLMSVALNSSTAFNIGVLSRVHHLLPLLRSLITLLSPPRAIVDAKPMHAARRSVVGFAAAPASSSLAASSVSPALPASPPFSTTRSIAATADSAFGTVVPDTSTGGSEGEVTAPVDELLTELSLANTAPELASPQRKRTFASLSNKLNRLTSVLSSDNLKADAPPADASMELSGSLGMGDRRASLVKFRAFEAAALEISGSPSTIKQTLTDAEREMRRAQQAEEEAERLKQVHGVLRGIAECHDALAFTSFVVALCNKLAKPQASLSASFRAVPSSLIVPLARRNDQWRDLMLGYLYYTHVGPHSSAFRTLPQPRQPGTSGSNSGDEPGSPGSPNFRRRATGLRASIKPGGADREVAEVSFRNISDMRSHWRDRMTKRRACGDDARAVESIEFHNACVANIARSSFYGDDIKVEAQRVYTMYSAASPTIANSRVITTDFLAAKLRIVFGKDSSFWKPVTSTRVISSAREMEEFIVTLASLSATSPYHLADRLVSVLDDTDLFFVALGSEALFDAFSAHLADLSVIFSLYAEGEPPDFVVTAEGWSMLNKPLLDSQYTQAMAETTFATILNRNRRSAKIFRREADGDDVSAAELERNGKGSNLGTLRELNQSKYAHGGARVGDPTTTSPNNSTISPMSTSMRPGGSEVNGFDMDGFCQALCVVVSFKDPNPFISLDAKIGPFIQMLLVPMVGAKSKQQIRRLSSTESGPGAAAAHYRRHTLAATGALPLGH